MKKIVIFILIMISLTGCSVNHYVSAPKYIVTEYTKFDEYIEVTYLDGKDEKIEQVDYYHVGYQVGQKTDLMQVYTDTSGNVTTWLYLLEEGQRKMWEVENAD